MGRTRVTMCALAESMLLLATASGWAQQPQAPPMQWLTQRLGVYVFPSKGQSTTQQTVDENNCYSWAKARSGIDPLASSPQTPPNQAAAAQNGNEAAAAGQGSAARGAAGGAAIGAIAGNAGKGAAIGATIGGVRRARVRRQAEEEAEAQKQQAQAAASQNQAHDSQRLSTYNKAFSACLEGKGYTVK